MLTPDIAALLAVSSVQVHKAIIDFSGTEKAVPQDDDACGVTQKLRQEYSGP